MVNIENNEKFITMEKSSIVSDGAVTVRTYSN
jgi:hypothetical protein